MISYLVGVLFLSLHPTMAQTTVDPQVQDFSNRNADFAARLYRAVSSQTDDNIFLCPLTVSVGLSALMTGAEGTTREQLLQGLGLTGLDPETVPDLFLSLIKSVTEQTADFELRQGVAVIPAQRFLVGSSYLDIVQNKYRGNTQSMAYTNPAETRDVINRWVQEQTGDQIMELVDTIDPESQLLLFTATYLQGVFTLAFNSSLTQDERFYVDKYHIVMVPMMFRSDKYFLAYDRLLKAGVLRLPMTGGAAMLVVLPDENVDITAVEEEVTAEKIQAWIRQLKKTKLEVQIPRFSLERSYKLRDTLQNLQITEVFQDNADLSNIGGENTLKLTQVFHKAMISADESGSSSDGSSGRVFPSPPPRLTINRPFLFVVYQETSGSVLLMGRVVDPSKK
ncbi:serpin peptidase inhibitor, clade A (alpha-1 antiproteinase, antitrypsin), member 10a [Genypterus blacodes]|uniref:serpin peptidase inhibitor, clade A (alpha-1 antiproteinase, antitrypsin), member 10a n=1 Tax=Genypterus blacodes TaxID=154954 RepID=UPI003F773504